MTSPKATDKKTEEVLGLATMGRIDEVIEKLVVMHPLKAALATLILVDHLHTLEKVNLFRNLERALSRHFVVEKHGYSVRVFAGPVVAERWVDKNAGARLVEGEK